MVRIWHMKEGRKRGWGEWQMDGQKTDMKTLTVSMRERVMSQEKREILTISVFLSQRQASS